jgi:hypothetical protein
VLLSVQTRNANYGYDVISGSISCGFLPPDAVSCLATAVRSGNDQGIAVRFPASANIFLLAMGPTHSVVSDEYRGFPRDEAVGT